MEADDAECTMRVPSATVTKRKMSDVINAHPELDMSDDSPTVEITGRSKIEWSSPPLPFRNLRSC